MDLEAIIKEVVDIMVAFSSFSSFLLQELYYHL